MVQQFPHQGPCLDQGGVLPTNSHIVVDAPAVLLSHPLWVLGGCSTGSWQIRGAGNGPWPDLPTTMCSPSFLELQTRSEAWKYQFRSTIPPLFLFSLFICCLSEDLVGDIQLTVGSPLPINRLITLIIVPVFWGFRLRRRGWQFSCKCWSCLQLWKLELQLSSGFKNLSVHVFVRSTSLF